MGTPAAQAAPTRGSTARVVGSARPPGGAGFGWSVARHELPAEHHFHDEDADHHQHDRADERRGGGIGLAADHPELDQAFATTIARKNN